MKSAVSRLLFNCLCVPGDEYCQEGNMKQLPNTFVRDDAGRLSYAPDHETVKVEVSGKTQLQAPLHHLGALFTFWQRDEWARFLCTTARETGKAIVFLRRKREVSCQGSRQNDGKRPAQRGTV